MELLKIHNIIFFLKQEEIKNLSIIGFAKNNPVSGIWQEGNSVAVKGTSEGDWIYFSSDNKEEFIKLLDMIDPSVNAFGSLYTWMIPLLQKDKETDWILSAHNYYLPEDVNLNHMKVATRKLTHEDIPHILHHSHYKQFLTYKYLEDRINKSYSAGIDMNGELVAWGLTHDDGALGSLHVTDDYRGHGFAKEIIKSLVEQCRDNDEIPFAQVEPNNIASIKLLEKLGFARDREIVWIKAK